MSKARPAGALRRPSAAPRQPPAPRVVAAQQGSGHAEREDHPWEIHIPDHPKRTDSPTYVVSRKLMNAIAGDAGALAAFLGGGAPYQDHHGGGLWVKDDEGWLFVKNLAGMEWSQQFCADPKKVDRLRQYAKRLCAAFPQTLPALKARLAGADYPLEDILERPIATQADVARWVDSIFNASVPLDARRHTGVLEPKGKASGAAPQIEGGVHHYPTPITDIQLFKYDDFQLWVVDAEGALAAVTPAHPRGSGRGEVNVAFATPGTKLHKRWIAAHKKGQHLQLAASHPLAKQAFAAQLGVIARARRR
jgi:hypothetical protein